jgi:hypothetical protein
VAHRGLRAPEALGGRGGAAGAEQLAQHDEEVQVDACEMNVAHVGYE